MFRNVNIKGKFGFIEIEDEGDAEDAIKDLDGKSFNGGRWGIPTYPLSLCFGHVIVHGYERLPSPR